MRCSLSIIQGNLALCCSLPVVVNSPQSESAGGLVKPQLAGTVSNSIRRET